MPMIDESINYQGICRASPHCTMILHTDAPRFTIADVSSGYVQLMGHPREEFVGRGLFEALPANPNEPGSTESERIRESLEAVVREERVDSVGAIRYDIPRLDGDGTEFDVRYWSLRHLPVFDKAGELAYIFQQIDEVTEFMLRGHYSPIGEHDAADKRIVLVDEDSHRRQYLAGLFGVQWDVETTVDPAEAREMMRGEAGKLLFWSVDAIEERHIAFIEKVRSENDSPWMQAILKACRPDKKRILAAFEAGWNDMITGTLAPREVVARVQLQLAAAELRKAVEAQSRRRYHRLFTDAPFAIALVEGSDHVFTLTNPTYEELIGDRDPLDKPIREVFSPEEGDEWFEQLDHVYETGEPYFRNEEPIELGDYEGPKYVSYALIPFEGMDREVAGVAIFGVDVTDEIGARQQAERLAAEAEHESRRKDEFLAMLSHELRNPLAPISHAASILGMEATDPNPETVEWAGETIDRQLAQLSQLVDELLDVARINEGRIELDEEPVDLEDVVRAAVETCRPTLEDRDQSLSVEVESDLKVSGDRPRLVQVATNLLNNASKYTHVGGHVGITARRDGDRVELQVEDNGKGIEPELLDDIFEPFVQQGASIDRDRGGLGLGLTLVRRLVEMHGGEVGADSDGPGEGSRFTIRLPHREIDRRPESDRDRLESVSEFALDVLLVEDNSDVADALRMLLTPVVDDIEVANDGASATEAAESHQPDVIFLDIGLPDIDGYEVARRIRATEAGERPFLVALTGYGRDVDRNQAIEAGFDEHLVKPATFDQLKSMLAEASNRNRSV